MDKIIFFPFAVYGMYKFAKWWLHMLWQTESDCLTSRQGWLPLLEPATLLAWFLSTMTIIDKNAISFYLIFPYMLLTFIGPISSILSMMREYGFGNTELGKKLGCYPRTKEGTWH